MAKIYQDGDAFLLETENGNFEIRNNGMFKTEREASGMTEAYPDTTVQAVTQNAVEASGNAVDLQTAKVIQSIIQHMIETAQ